MNAVNEMSQLFDTSEQEAKTLVIIGNGFDLMHNIASSMSDFKDWIRMQGDAQFITLMENFFVNDKYDLWKDLEVALGKYDERIVLDWCNPINTIDYDHPMHSVANIEDSPDYLFKTTLDTFKNYFRQWVESIDISFAKKQTYLSPRCLYFTFNYTETLEKVYDIPSDRITHIHGSRLNKDEYIIGHNNYRDSNDYDMEGKYFYAPEANEKILSWMNELCKDTSACVKRHSSFFNSLSETNNVITIGHSLGEIDWPYFESITKNVSSNTSWTINWHDFKDLKQAGYFVERFKLMNVRLKQR